MTCEAVVRTIGLFVCELLGFRVASLRHSPGRPGRSMLTRFQFRQMSGHRDTVCRTHMQPTFTLDLMALLANNANLTA